MDLDFDDVPISDGNGGFLTLGELKGKSAPTSPAQPPINPSNLSFDSVPISDGQGGFITLGQLKGTQQGRSQQEAENPSELELRQQQYLEENPGALNRFGQRFERSARRFDASTSMIAAENITRAEDDYDERMATKEADDREKARQLWEQAGRPTEDPYAFYVPQKSYRPEGRREFAKPLVDNARRQNEAAAKIPEAPVATYVMQADTLEDVWEGMKVDPLSFIAEVGVSSLAQSMASMIAGVAGAAVGGLPGAMAGTGAASGATDFANSFMSGLSKHGVDINDSNAVIEAFSDRELMQSIKEDGDMRAVMIGLFDALSLGIASKTFISGGKLAKFGDVAFRTGASASMGGAGEAAGELVEGRTPRPGEVVAEIAGELLTAPSDFAMAAFAKRSSAEQELDDAINSTGDEIREAVEARQQERSGQTTPADVTRQNDASVEVENQPNVARPAPEQPDITDDIDRELDELARAPEDETSTDAQDTDPKYEYFLEDQTQDDGYARDAKGDYIPTDAEGNLLFPEQLPEQAEEQAPKAKLTEDTTSEDFIGSVQEMVQLSDLDMPMDTDISDNTQNSATAESQAIPSESNVEATNNEVNGQRSEPTQQEQIDDGDSAARNSLQESRRDNANVGEQEVDAAPGSSSATRTAQRNQRRQVAETSSEVKPELAPSTQPKGLTRPFEPRKTADLVDRRDQPDAEAVPSGNISGGKDEKTFFNERDLQKKFDEIGYSDGAVLSAEFDQSLVDQVVEKYGSSIPNVNAARLIGSPPGMHYNGAVVIANSIADFKPKPVSKRSVVVARILAHEFGHASHSLLGDTFNTNPAVPTELESIEQVLYPGLREKVQSADNADTDFFNYLLDANELVAEFNVLRLLDLETAKQTAPTIASLLESVEGAKNLVVSRSTHPDLFLNKTSPTGGPLSIVRNEGEPLHIVVPQWQEHPSVKAHMDAIRRPKKSNVGQQDVDATPGSSTTRTAQRNQRRQVAKANATNQPVRRLSNRQRSKITKVIDRAVKRSNGRVRKYSSIDDPLVPAEVKRSVLSQKRRDATVSVPALVHKGQMHVFEDQLRSKKDAQAILAHESTHLGLVDHFGSQRNLGANLLNLLGSTENAPAVLQRIAERTGMPMELYEETYADVSSDVRLSVIVEEVLAHLRENQVANQNAYQRFMDMIREWLNTAGIRLPTLRGNQTEEQAFVSLLRDAERAYNRTNRRNRRDGVTYEGYMSERYALKHPDTQIGFYSTLHKAALNMKQKRGSGQQMLKSLSNMPEVKAEEIQWTGLDAFLLSFEGPITSDEIANYLYDNGVNLSETLLESDGDVQRTLSWDDGRVDDDPSNWENRVEDYMNDFDNGDWDSHIMDMDKAVTDYFEENLGELEDYRSYVGDDESDLESFDEAIADVDIKRAIKLIEFDGEISLMDELKPSLRDRYEEEANSIAEAQYMDDPYMIYEDEDHGYRIYGNDDIGYTVNNHRGYYNDDIYDIDAAKEDAEEHARETDVLSNSGETNFSDSEYNMFADEPDSNYRELLLTLPDVEGEFYNQNHFTEEPNIVAFLRISDAMVEGSDTKAMVIEEMQSDWHQEGRRYGYDDAKGEALQEQRKKEREVLARRIRYTGRLLEKMADDPLLMQWTRANRRFGYDEYYSWEQHIQDEKAEFVKFASAMDRRSYDNINKRMAIFDGFVNKYGTTRAKDIWARKRVYFEKYEKINSKIVGAFADLPPPAPYGHKDSWIELGVRKAILHAIEQGFDTIAWVGAEQMAERWSDQYRALYDKQYDSAMPKLFKKNLKLKDKPVLNDQGVWVAKIDPELAGKIRSEGLPKFAQRSDIPPLVNRRQNTPDKFTRTGMEGIRDTVVRGIADKYEVLERVQEYVRKKGGRVTTAFDAYSAERRSAGKMMLELDTIKNEYVGLIADKLVDMGISYNEIDMYLYARHAEERNDFMRKRFGTDTTDHPSGMTDQEAQFILDKYDQLGMTAQLEDIAETVYAMNKLMLQKSEQAGLMHVGGSQEFQQRYKYFVPLKGFADILDESTGDLIPHTKSRSAKFGPGLNISGKEFRKAMGRETLASSPLANTIVDINEKIIRAAYNEVGNHFLRFVIANKDDDQWKVFSDMKPDMTRQWIRIKDKTTGAVSYKMSVQKMSPMQMEQNYFRTKYRGNQYYIKIADPRLHKAMMNLGPEQSGMLIKAGMAYNRYFSMVHTSINPDFAVTNFLRDYQAGMIKVMAEQSRDDGQLAGKQIAKDVASDVFKGRTAIARMLANKPPRTDTSHPSGLNEWDTFALEYREAGAMTGFFDSKSVEQMEESIRNMVKWRSNATTAGAIKAMDKTGEVISNLNSSVENAIRLSAYVHARKAGVTKENAANMAKDLTVNFNARGEHSNTLGAMYLFANPTIQGIRQIARVMYGLNGDGSLRWKNLNTGQKVAMSVVAMSFGYAMLARAFMGKDDDGVDLWDKIPSYDKERAWIIPKYWTDSKYDYIPVPAPYGYNVFKVLGESLERAVSIGPSAFGVSSKQMLGALLGSFSPIGMAGSDTLTGTIVKTALPTAAVPFLEVSMNENFFGSPIYNEGSPFGVPDPASSMGRASTGAGYNWAAKFLNEWAGGGSEFITGDNLHPGFFDVHPETIKYWTTYFAGGAGNFFINKLGDNSMNALLGEPYNFENMPILGRFQNSIKGFDDEKLYFRRRNQIGQVVNDYSNAVLTGDKKRIRELEKKYDNIHQLEPRLKRTEKQLRNLRKERRELFESPLSYAERFRKAKEIEKDMEAIIDDFNKAYNEKRRSN